MPEVRAWSLRRQLFAITALATLATLLIGGGAMYWAARQEDAHLLDMRLADLGRTVLAFSEHEIAEIRQKGLDDGVHDETAATLGTRYHYQIWSADGRTLLLRSLHVSAVAPMVPLTARGFSDVTIQGEPFRVFALADPGRRMVLQVAENLGARRSGLVLTSAWFLGFLIVPFSGIALLTGWLLDRSLRAVDESAAQVGQRRPFDLAPIAVRDPPAELQPMIAAINGLFGRIHGVLSLERGFTAVAAHELRTPLAGLRAQAQLAAATDSAVERAEALAGVMRGVDKAAYLVDQLLDLVRSESLALNPGSDRTDAGRALAHVRAELDTEISRRRLRVETDISPAARPRCSEPGLVLLLRNLLANAVRYTPEGGAVAVHVVQGVAGVTVQVDDSGPGIPLERRQRSFERFERLGRQDDTGVGLGLAIVQAVAAAHGATVWLQDSPLGGLRVEVFFPAAEPSSSDATVEAGPRVAARARALSGVD